MLFLYRSRTDDANDLMDTLLAMLRTSKGHLGTRNPQIGVKKGLVRAPVGSFSLLAFVTQSEIAWYKTCRSFVHKSQVCSCCTCTRVEWTGAHVHVRETCAYESRWHPTRALVVNTHDV